MIAENEEVFLDLSKGNEEADAEAARLAAEQAEAEKNNQNTETEEAARLAAEQAELEASTSSQAQVTIEDSRLLEILSEKLGRQIESLDELTKKEERQLNPQIQAIAEWADRTGRPVEDWTKYNKDYSTMSDIEKAKEILTLKYPSFNEKEIQLELNKYLESEDDLEEDIEMKTLELKKLVANDSKLLDDVKLELGKPIEGYNSIPEELKADLEFAKQAKQTYEDTVKNVEKYETEIVNSVTKMTGLEINLDEGLNITYTIPAEEKKDIPTFIAEMPHWRNADGSFNHDAIVQDGIKLKNFDKLMKMAYAQGQATGSENVLKDANNITLDRQLNDSVQPDASNGITVEGLDKILGSGTRVKFGKFKRNQ